MFGSPSPPGPSRRTDEEIMEMITEADLDEDHQINFNEFYRVMKVRTW